METNLRYLGTCLINLHDLQTQGNGFVTGPTWGIEEVAQNVDRALATVFAMEEAAQQMPTADQPAIRQRINQILDAAERNLQVKEAARRQLRKPSAG